MNGIEMRLKEAFSEDWGVDAVQVKSKVEGLYEVKTPAHFYYVVTPEFAMKHLSLTTLTKATFCVLVNHYVYEGNDDVEYLMKDYPELTKLIGRG